LAAAAADVDIAAAGNGQDDGVGGARPWRKFTLLVASAGAAAALAADNVNSTPADAAIVPKVIANLLGFKTTFRR
jgi:hypothetical protein